MNANPKFLSADARVDAAAIAPLPNSRKVYVTGSRPDIRVPMREISLADTPTGFGGEKNPPIYVYDTSGPYTDPDASIDLRTGLPALRPGWIDERGDTEILPGLTSAYGRERAADAGHRRAALPRPAPHAAPRAGRRERHADALRAPGHHHAGDGIHRHPREPAPRRIPREPQGERPERRQARRDDGPPASGARRSAPPPSARTRWARSRPSSCARKSRAAARSSPPTSTTRNRSR